MSFVNIKLSEVQKYKKFQLASIAGYIVKEEERKCYIVGADNQIDNCFKNIDEVLLLIRDDLSKYGYMLTA